MSEEQKSEIEFLRNHAEQIASLVLNRLGIESYKVVISEDKNCELIEADSWHGEYVCIIYLESNHLLTTAKDSLHQMLGKPVFTNANHTLYWFEGDNLATQNISEIELNDLSLPEEDKIEVEKLKTDTRLPQWLDNYIFDVLEAQFSPDFERFGYNLDLSQKEVNVYLGTYFPRSYGESFCIINDLLQNPEYIDSISKKDSISVLDVGAGTGGNLIGLIYAINKNIHKKLKFEITVIDGNSDSLKVLKTIVDAVSSNLEIEIELTIINEVFSSIADLNTILESVPQKHFDWTLSFKMVCEIIQKGNQHQNSYFEILNLLSERISPTGLLLLLDVTTKLENTDYLPLLLNKQTNNFIIQNNQFKTLAPLCCGQHGMHCSYDCFYQQTFRVTHKEKRKDISKVAYRILGYSDFVDVLIKDIEQGKSVITWQNKDNEYIATQNCVHTALEPNVIDPYKLH
ncbi:MULTISPECIES: hypothetical protein [unclassified Carboxylicivirga]|uniref:hypothetical protein n=1 Tax=Carboxylicivirga TaxID=1628153 RepID=UPI003D333967